MSEKLHQLTMRAFRGVPNDMTVDFGKGQSIAIYGDNGTGKSTIADAIEWFFTGQIELLSHEGRQHAIRNLGGDVGANRATSVELVTSGELGGKVDFPDEREVAALNVAARETFLLRGRTLADFINKTKTEKWKALVEILGLDAVEGLRQDLQRVRTELRKQAKDADAELRAAGEALSPDGEPATEESILGSLRQICELLGVDKPSSLDRVADPAWAASVVGVSAANPEKDARGTIQSELQALTTPAVDPEVVASWNELVTAESSAELSRVSLLQQATRHFEGASAEGRCPLCRQEVDPKELARRLQDELTGLLEARDSLETRRSALAELAEDLAAAEARRGALLAGARQSGLDLPALPSFPRQGLKEALEGPEPIDGEALAIELSRLADWDASARELASASTDGADAPSSRQSQLAMFAGLCEQIKTWRTAAARASRAARARDIADRIFDAYQARQKKDVAELLERISSRVAEIYTALHPGEDLGAVSIEPWTAKGVELAIDFYGSRQRPPHGVLSESHLNSLAIALFLAMAQTFNETIGFLVLDDVINSFDLEHRGQLADLLANRFSDWQLVVLTHDHQFFEHLTRRAPSWKKLELTSWSYGEGPRTTRYDGAGLLAEARERLSRDDVNGAATKARRALEEQLQEVCHSLQALLPFRRGAANDRRELGELFKGVRRALKENAKGLLGELDPLLKSLEADVSATFNVEAHASRGRSAPGEVEAAITRIEELDRHWSCASCNTRIWHKGTPESARCKCGKSLFPPAPA